MASIKDMLDQYLADGVMTKDEHDAFIEEVHADGQIDAEEQEQISRIFKMIQEGTLKIVDSERDKFEEIRKEELKKKLEEMSKSQSSITTEIGFYEYIQKTEWECAVAYDYASREVSFRLYL